MTYREQLKTEVTKAVSYWHDDGMDYWDLVERVLGDVAVWEALELDENENPIDFYSVLDEVLTENNYSVRK